MNITLKPHHEQFINQQIREGRYKSVSEAVHAALGLLEIQETKREILRQSLIEGEKSGIADYSLEEFIEELDTE